jgi:tRNA pseudouridine38-40 synthase
VAAARFRPDLVTSTRPAAVGAALRTLRLSVAYDGTEYQGWQVQRSAPTVQGALVTAARALDPAARVIGASRTDAGVHALAQSASLTMSRSLAPAAVMAALNAALPRDIRVLAAAEASVGFDARRAARGKRYAYLIDNRPIAVPLLRRYAWHVPTALDVTAMRHALGVLRGRHDFSAFCAAPGREKDPVCEIRAAHVVRRKDRIAILVSADRFLHHMMRNIVGSLVAVGRGGRGADWLPDVLASRDRRRAGPTAPAHGLVLVRVLYPR